MLNLQRVPIPKVKIRNKPRVGLIEAIIDASKNSEAVVYPLEGEQSVKIFRGTLYRIMKNKGFLLHSKVTKDGNIHLWCSPMVPRS